MEEDEEKKSSNNILSSPFFEPSIIDKFLQSTIADKRFPRLAIHYLMQHDDEIDGNKKELNERLDGLRSSNSQFSPFYLSDDHKIGLRDTIQALCTFLALPNPSKPPFDQSEKQQQQEPKQIDFHKNRVFLGFCRLLNGQPTESGFEFDLVRQELFTKQNKRNKNKKSIQFPPSSSQTTGTEEDEEKAIYLDALWGAELSAELLGKSSEAERYRKWRTSSVH